MIMASSSSSSVLNPATTDKPNLQTASNHQPLPCPRCNSSNTKFCYYNNYSLSQPRHFCKACKRYWTRGGTLRNVPVGGGCRRKKRLKGGGDGATPAAARSAPSNTKYTNNLSPPSDRAMNNPLIYGLQASDNLHPLNFPVAGLSSARVCGERPGFDFQPQMSGFGLGFSNGPPFGSSPSPFSAADGNNSALFGSSAYGTSSSMASLLASTFEELQMLSHHRENGVMGYNNNYNYNNNNKHVKEEAGENGFGFGNPDQIEQFNSSDPASLSWSTTNLGAWFEPSNSNMGSSVPSLI